MSSSITSLSPLEGPENGKLLSLTICGYRRPGMSEADYRHHMNNVSAPMTQDLMVKYGIIRWTQIHNQEETRALMSQLFDPQMANLADFDCFSQVVFRSVEDYKRMKRDPWYKKHLVGDHEKFADTKRSMMTIGWIRQFIDNGKVIGKERDMAVSRLFATGHHVIAIVTGSVLSGAMMALSLVAVPVFLDTATNADQLIAEWARMYHYGHRVLPGMAITTFALYLYTAIKSRAAQRAWKVFALAGILTLAMVPFTWLIMVPTNDILFGLDAQRVAEQTVASLEEVRGLVTYWSALHLTRSLFPLSGAVVGALVAFEKLSF